MIRGKADDATCASDGLSAKKRVTRVHAGSVNFKSGKVVVEYPHPWIIRIDSTVRTLRTWTQIAVRIEAWQRGDRWSFRQSQPRPLCSLGGNQHPIPGERVEPTMRVGCRVAHEFGPRMSASPAHSALSPSANRLNMRAAATDDTSTMAMKWI